MKAEAPALSTIGRAIRPWGRGIWACSALIGPLGLGQGLAAPPAHAAPRDAASPTAVMATDDAGGTGTGMIGNGAGDTAADAQLQALMADYWRWAMTQAPEYASSLGEPGGAGQLSDLSLAAADAAEQAQTAFLARLDAVPDRALNPANRINRAILARQLRQAIAANHFGQRMMLFTAYASWHQGFAFLAETSPFNTHADYTSYLERLARYPEMNAQGMAVTRQAVAQGYVQPCVAMEAFEKSITGVIAPEPESSRFYAPFKRARPADVTQAQWAAMQAQARQLITRVVNPEYQRFADYYRQEYRCRQTVGASALPDGAAWYAEQVRIHTTTDLTPAQVHRIGLDEVARIDAAMDRLARTAGYPDRHAYSLALRRDPAFQAPTPAALMLAAAGIAKQIDGELPRYFGRLPRMPFTLRPVPAETAEGTTAAYYQTGSVAARNAGVFYLNTSKLSERPLYALPALTAHEAMPGHHLQLALQQEAAVQPKFRQHLVYFTAFGEGWGLYAEYLGESMGLYDTPAKQLGRLSFEAWRACRLVVDTGLHALGWSKAQAKQFMRDHSAEPEANIEAEVNRYITWPGQALGYKIGELRIRALRAKAEQALGPRFSLPAFHDLVLSQGAVPLDVLDAMVMQWIAATRRQGDEGPHDTRNDRRSN